LQCSPKLPSSFQKKEKRRIKGGRKGIVRRREGRRRGWMEGVGHLKHH